jgi:hypothetical protein
MLFQQQERQAGEVIAVQMAEEDRIDARGIDGMAAHRDQRRRAASSRHAPASEITMKQL